VNADEMARERGLDVRTVSSSTATDYLNTITLRSGHLALSGTLAGLSAEQRIVMIDDHPVDVPPSDHMLVVRNDDRPGMIGLVGTVVGDAGVNVANMTVGHDAGAATAVMVLTTDQAVGADVVASLAEQEGIISVHGIGLT